MKKIFYVLLTLVLFACDDATQPTAGFECMMNDAPRKAQKAFYSEDGGKVNVSAVFDDHAIWNLVVRATDSGTYPVEASSTVIMNGEMFIISSGELKFDKSASQTLEGTFSFVAKESESGTEIKVIGGKFNMLPKENSDTAPESSFTTKQRMSLDMEKGEVKTQDIQAIIMYSATEISIDFPTDGKSNLVLPVERYQNTETGVTLFVKSNDIQYVTVDKVKNNQTTIWYKNENTQTLF